jgi:hypothetical protein
MKCQTDATLWKRSWQNGQTFGSCTVTVCPITCVPCSAAFLGEELSPYILPPPHFPDLGLCNVWLSLILKVEHSVIADLTTILKRPSRDASNSGSTTEGSVYVKDSTLRVIRSHFKHILFADTHEILITKHWNVCNKWLSTWIKYQE